MTQPSLDARIRGALLGAAIGAEFAYARSVYPERFAVENPADILSLALAPAGEVAEEHGRVTFRRVTPFVNLGVQAYLQKGGRAVPEDLAALLRDDAEIAGPMFGWDGVHSIQEILKEGMHPRVSGMLATPCGLIAAAMPAVGIYHFADPEYAYLDGVELASVAQGRAGADWAALCAAAVAAALAPDATPASVVEAAMKLAHENNKDVFYQLNRPLGASRWQRGDAQDFARWWMAEGGTGGNTHDLNWVAVNPLMPVLPLLERFAGNPAQYMALIVGPGCASWYDSMAGTHAVSATIGGAVIGALNGEDLFPAEWRAWADEIIAPWLPLAGVVQKRLCTERVIVNDVEEMAQPAVGGGSQLLDKVYGCMLAGAIGNAMGSPVEGQLYWEIDKKYPGGVTGVLDPSRLEGEDDNQMAMHLMETYLDRDGKPVMARHFGKAWAERLNRDHFFALCMGHAYDLIRQGWDPRITGHWITVTGSTVMCLEPVGLFHPADQEFAAIDATAVAYMYQRGLDMLAATMLAATVAEALRPRATVDSVLQAALNVAPKTPLHTFDKRDFASAYDYLSTCLEIADKYDDVLAVRKELYDKCLFYHMIDPLELWGYALAMFKIADGHVREAALGGTNIGRDSDTIAGRAAMLSGTLRGAGDVPAEWTRLFSASGLERIRRNAGRFTDLIVRKTARLHIRQAAQPAHEELVAEEHLHL